MKNKIVLLLFLLIFLSACKDEVSVPQVVDNSVPQIIDKPQLSNQVFTLDRKLVGTVESIKDTLNNRVLKKSKILTNQENEFICNCFINELRTSNDSDSILTTCLNKCTEILRVQRQKNNPNKYIYSTDGEFIGTKETLKKEIIKELKTTKINDISGVFLDDIVDCIGNKYRKMTIKEIRKHKDIFLECMINNYPKNPTK